MDGVIQVHRKDEKRVISSGNLDGKLNIDQFRGLEQPAGDQSCGYYALYFSKLLHYAFVQRVGSEKLYKMLNDRKSFEEFKNGCLDYLKNVATRKKSECYPWTEKDIMQGALEHAYLQELQSSNYGKENGICSDVIVTLFGFGLSSLKTNRVPLESVSRIEEVFQAKFDSNTSDVFQTFMLGVSIHFVCVAVHKSRDGNTNIIYIDPQNQDILFKTDSHLEELTMKMEFKSWIEAGWKRDNIESLCLDAFKGISLTMDVLGKRALGKACVKSFFMELNLLQGFAQSYKDVVKKKLVEEKKTIIVKRLFGADLAVEVDGYLSRLKLWSKYFYPAAVIDSNITKAIARAGSLPIHVIKHLLSWEDEVRTKLHNTLNEKEVMEEDKKYARKLLFTLGKFKKTLKDVSTSNNLNNNIIRNTQALVV